MSTLDLPTRGAVLASFLQRRKLTAKEVEGCLIEFVTRSWNDGDSVRKCCRDVNEVLELIPISDLLRETLQYPGLATLMPFLQLPSTDSFPFPTLEPPSPPPLIDTHEPRQVTHTVLIDTLTRLSWTLHSEGSRPFCDEQLVSELCLEYIAAAWRRPVIMGSHDVVDGISKRLTEVEFELRLQGHPETVQEILFPTLLNIRHTLGFLTCSQLITRLNSSTTPTFAEAHAAKLADQPNATLDLLRTWAVRRLCAGLSYQVILDELSTVRGTCDSSSIKDAISSVLVDLGLPGQTLQPPSEQFGMLWVQRSVSTHSSTHKRTRTLPRLITKMGRKNSIDRRTPKCFSHRRSHSSNIRIRTSLDLQGTPSTPGDSAPVTPQTPSVYSSPITLTFPSHEQLSPTAPPVTAYRSTTSFHDDLTSSLMSLTDAEDVHTVLFGQLLEMRYHIHGSASDGWFLGGGRERAQELIRHLERRMIGRKDLMGLREVFDAMRVLFGLGTAPSVSRAQMSTYSTGSESRPNTYAVTKDTRRTPPFDLGDFASTTSHDLQATESDLVTVPQDRCSDPSTIALLPQPMSNSQSTSPSPRAESRTPGSICTSTSLLNSDSQLDLTRSSTFEIQAVTLAYPTEQRAMMYTLPLQSGVGYRETMQSDWEKNERYPSHGPNKLNEKYTRLPPRIGTSRMNGVKPIFRASPFTNNGKDLPAIPLVSYSSVTPFKAEAARTVFDESSLTRIPPFARPVTSVRPVSRSRFGDPTPPSARSASDPRPATPFSLEPSKDLDGGRKEKDPVVNRSLSASPVSPRICKTANRSISPLSVATVISAIDARHSACSTDGHEQETNTAERPKRQLNIRGFSPLPKRTSSLSPKSGRSGNTSRLALKLPMPSTSSPARSGTSPPTSRIASDIRLPLECVIELLKQGAGGCLTPLQVENAMMQTIAAEKQRLQARDMRWNQEAQAKMVWLLEQAVILLDDPVVGEVTRRVIHQIDASEDAHDVPPTRIPLSARRELVPKKAHLYGTPSHAQSQPALSSSFVPSAPRRLFSSTSLAVKYRGLQKSSSCFSIASVEDSTGLPRAHLQTSVALYGPQRSTPTRPGFPVWSPSPLVPGRHPFSVDKAGPALIGASDNRGYVDWETPLIEKLEFPVPKVRARGFSETSVGTFGRRRKGSLIMA